MLSVDKTVEQDVGEVDAVIGEDLELVSVFKWANVDDIEIGISAYRAFSVRALHYQTLNFSA